jgi:hypothetical protein
VAEEEVKPEEVKPVEAKPTEPEAKPVEAKPTEPTPAPEEEAGFDYEQPYEEGRKLMRVYLAGKYHTTVIVFEGQVVVAPYEETGPLYSAGQTLNPGQSITQQGTIK